MLDFGSEYKVISTISKYWFGLGKSEEVAQVVFVCEYLWSVKNKQINKNKENKYVLRRKITKQCFVFIPYDQ